MGMMNPGDPLTKISARSWNRHEAAAEYILRRKQLGDPGHRERDYPDSNVVMVRNLAGANLPRGAVVELGAMIVDETPMNALWFEGNEPDTTRPFGILRRALPQNKIDEAQLSGVVIARVDVQDVDQQYAIVVSGATVLDSASWGPIRLLSPAAGTGVQDMAVCLQPVESGISVVQLNHATATAGDIVAANASGVHPARIKHWNGSGYSNGTAVWLLLTDYYDVDSGDVIGEHAKYYGPATLAGEFTHSADTRPLYIARVGDQTFIGKPDANIAKAASGTVSLWHRGTEADSTINKTAEALGAAVTSGKWVTVQRIAGQWYVGCWET